jgi:hypothetical protein
VSCFFVSRTEYCAETDDVIRRCNPPHQDTNYLMGVVLLCAVHIIVSSQSQTYPSHACYNAGYTGTMPFRLRTSSLRNVIKPKLPTVATAMSGRTARRASSPFFFKVCVTEVEAVLWVAERDEAEMILREVVRRRVLASILEMGIVFAKVRGVGCLVVWMRRVVSGGWFPPDVSRATARAPLDKK